MRAVAASRKLAKRAVQSDSEKSGSNGGPAYSGVRQKINNQRQAQKQRTYASSSLYAPPTSSTSVSEHIEPVESTELLLPSTSGMVPGQGGVSNAIAPSRPKASEHGKTTPVTEMQTFSALSPGSSEKGQSKGGSLASVANGPLKKNPKDTMSRTISNLSHAPSSVATTTRVESRVGVKRSAAEKRYYAKAITLMVFGGVVLAIGMTFAVLYFTNVLVILMIGPICLSIGLLLLVCGIVWLPIINTKLKRQQQIMSRTFSL